MLPENLPSYRPDSVCVSVRIRQIFVKFCHYVSAGFIQEKRYYCFTRRYARDSRGEPNGVGCLGEIEGLAM